MAGITWTKEWAGADDGTIVGGADLKNIQDDLSTVLTTSDIGVLVTSYTDPGVAVFWENDFVSWENTGIYVTS